MTEQPALPPITVRMCLDVVSARYNIPRVDLLSARRTRPIVLPRQLIMWLAKQRTVRSLPEIGRQLGGRDHTTVLHGIRQIEARRAADPKFRDETDEIIGTIDGAVKAMPSISGKPDLPDALRVALNIDLLGPRAKPSEEDVAALAQFAIRHGLQQGMLQVEGDDTDGDPELAPIGPLPPISAAVADLMLKDAAAKVVATRRQFELAQYSRGERAARDAFEAALTALATLFEERN